MPQDDGTSRALQGDGAPGSEAIVFFTFTGRPSIRSPWSQYRAADVTVESVDDLVDLDVASLLGASSRDNA